MLLTDLPAALTGGGCRVWTDPGYLTRGQGELAGVKAIMCHHTASTSATTWQVVRDGRTGLQGLLSQLCLERDGLWRVLGSGQAWHAGTGGPLLGIPADSANAWTIGIEAVSAGTGDWTAAQLEAYPRGVAALCRRYGLTADQVVFHKSWAPTRKIDIAGWPGDLEGFRAQVRAHLTTTTGDWLDMATIDDVRKVIREELGRTVWETTGVLPNRRGPGGAQAGAYADTLFGYALTAEGATYRIEQAITKLAAQPAGGALSDADVNRVAAAVLDLLAKRAAA